MEHIHSFAYRHVSYFRIWPWYQMEHTLVLRLHGETPYLDENIKSNTLAIKIQKILQKLAVLLGNFFF